MGRIVQGRRHPGKPTFASFDEGLRRPGNPSAAPPGQNVKGSRPLRHALTFWQMGARYSRAASSAAICSALATAPLRRSSETMNRSRPRSWDGSARIRPTSTASSFTASMGIG